MDRNKKRENKRGKCHSTTNGCAEHVVPEHCIFNNNSISEKLWGFIFVISRLFLHGNFCWDFTFFFFWSWKFVKLLMTYQNRRSKMSLKLVVSCFFSRKLESQYSWHFCQGSGVIHTHYLMLPSRIFWVKVSTPFSGYILCLIQFSCNFFHKTTPNTPKY